MTAEFGQAFALLFSGDPALWDVIFRSLWVSVLASVLAMLAAVPLAVLLDRQDSDKTERVLVEHLAVP